MITRIEKWLKKGKGEGFTLVELLVVILILGILLGIALPSFLGQEDGARNTKVESELRSALTLMNAEYLTAGQSYTKGPLATGETPKEKADNFVSQTLTRNGLEAVISKTPEEGKIGVWMNDAGTSGSLWVLASEGLREINLPPLDVILTGASQDTSKTIGGKEYRVVTWENTGSLEIKKGKTFDILLVAGGGGGGSYGGGGAGGVVVAQDKTLAPGTYTISVGGGGSGSTGRTPRDGATGEDTSAFGFVAKGGGGGGGTKTVPAGKAGGSGGWSSDSGAISSSNQANFPEATSYGNSGGTGRGGGGGAGGVGGNSLGTVSGNGGGGINLSALFGTDFGDSGWFASGGGAGGSIELNLIAGTASPGGGSSGGTSNANSAETSTGGGGGGGGYTSVPGNGGAGGSGIVILRWEI